MASVLNSVGARALIALSILACPLATPIFVAMGRIGNAPIRDLSLVAAIAFCALAVTIALTFLVGSRVNPAAGPFLRKVIYWTLAIALFDAVLFSVLTFVPNRPTEECRVGVECGRYPVMLFALIAMHLTHVTAFILIIRKLKLQEEH